MIIDQLECFKIPNDLLLNRFNINQTKLAAQVRLVTCHLNGKMAVPTYLPHRPAACKTLKKPVP